MPEDLSLNAMGSPREWAQRLAVMGAIGAFLGVTGGFGTYLEAPLVNRLAAWILEFWLGTLIYSPLISLGARFGGQRGWPLWATVPAAVLVSSLAMTPLTYFISAWVMGSRQTAPFLERYGDTLLVALPVAGAYTALRLRLAAGATTKPEPAAPPAPRRTAFLSRLPGRLGHDLMCLEMEDHYVRAHTAQGSDLILMRMRDAVAELDGLAGLQVHRSWWVAEAAVTGHKREGRQLSLVLKTGMEAPVARSAEAAVKAAGWLDRR